MSLQFWSHGLRPEGAAIGVLLAALVGGVSDMPASAADTNAPLHFTNAQDRFSLELPAGWQEMPAALAAVFRDAPLPEPGGPGSPPERHAYGFELSSQTNEIATPFVTVQVLRGYRMGDGYVRLLSNPEVLRRLVNGLAKREGVEESSITGVSYDPRQCSIQFSGTRLDENGTKLGFLHGVRLTEDGSINVTCVADAEEYGRWSLAFSNLLDSLTVDSAIAYQPRAVPLNVAAAQFHATRVILIPAVVVLLALARIIGRRFSDQVMSDEI